MTTMTPKDAATKLNGCEYGEEAPASFFAEMKGAGLVAVFGASDDLMEFRGAIYDEFGCYDGGTTAITPKGLPINECGNDDCPHFSESLKGLPTVTAEWDDSKGFTFTSSIPHETFTVMEDGQVYCVGIIFAMADAFPCGVTE